MQAKDISDLDVLNYLYDKQGSWTFLLYGSLKDIRDIADVYYAMPPGTPHKVALAKMRALHKRGLVGGCPCGCRGDFEITDKGLQFLNKPRIKKYSSY